MPLLGKQPTKSKIFPGALTILIEVRNNFILRILMKFIDITFFVNKSHFIAFIY
jgi:hypothetical protein